ncbi:MAG: hypothetical protein LUF91_02500 [Oscillospiraceae bacterium]|nr:hypothetical protein [Oscillospiraceae bacterium]
MAGAGFVSAATNPCPLPQEQPCPASGKQVTPADLCSAALKINAVALLPLVMGRGKVQTLNAFLKLYRTDKNETAGSFVSAAVAVRPSAVREIAILLAVFAVDFYKLPML